MSKEIHRWGSEGKHEGECKTCKGDTMLDTKYQLCGSCYQASTLIKKIPKIKGLHHKDTYGIFSGKVYVSNKLDGSSGRIRITEEGFILGSKGRVFKKRPYHPDHPTMDKIWWRVWDVIESKYEDIKHLPKTWTIFGEVCGLGNIHKIDYTFDLDFIVFDIWDHEKDDFIEPSIWEPIIKETSLSYVEHTYMKCDYDIIKTMVMSHDVIEDKFEGFVVKNFKCPHTYIPGGRLYGKIYHPDTEQKDSKVFGKVKDQEKYPLESKLLQDWVTVRRVTGCLHQGWDDGQPGHGMEVMQWLPKMVWEDIVREEFANWALTAKHKNGVIHIDLKFFRRRLSKIVAHHLQEYLIELAKKEEK